MAACRLPTLAQLVAGGITGPLASTLPPITAPAWASFMTGKHPQQHGIYDFFHHVGQGQVRMVSNAEIESALFWEYLSAAGIRCGILNVPLTHPPRPLAGYIIPGLLSPDQAETTYPVHVWQPYSQELGPYRLTPELLYRPGNETQFIAELHDVTNTQLSYAERLLTDDPVDLFMLHILATDIAQHKLWRHMDPTHPWHEGADSHRFADAILDLYVRIDTALAALLAMLPAESSVIVMSDHGFGPQHHTINLNILLYSAGLLSFKAGVGGRLRRLASRSRAGTRFGQRLWRRERLLSFDDVDWSRTRAYSLGHMGQIFINRAGRESHGIVRPAQVESVRFEVEEALRSWSLSRDPRFTVKITSNTDMETGPDLHVEIDEYQAPAYPMFAADGRIVTEQRLGDSGNHRRNGILIACGPSWQAGLVLNDARIVDLAPTILHYFDVPVPEDMDGRVLSELWREPTAVQRQTPLPSVDAHSGLSASDEEQVSARLRDLGYLGGS